MKPTCLRGLFTLACLFGPLSIGAVAQPVGRLYVTRPSEVLINQPFQVEVELIPNNADFNDTVTVQAGKNVSKVKSEPSVFALKVGEKKAVTLTVLNSDSGLGVIYFFANDDWKPYDETVIVGGVVTRIDVGLKEPVASGKVNTFFVKLTDKSGNAVRLEANAYLDFQGSNILLHDDQAQVWRRNTSAEWRMGEAISIPIQLKGDWWNSDTGALWIQLKTGQGLAVREETVNVQILPPWYVPLAVAVAGGLSFGIWQFLRRVLETKRKTARGVLLKALSKALVLGFGAGLLAYLLADWNILGIKTEKSGLQSLFLLGLLFSYVGADFILKLSAKRA